MANLTEVSSNKIFDGYQKVFVHDSKELGCKMNFGIYLPPQAEKIAKLPVIYWLSGLTCNEQNFIQKSGAQQYASQNGVIIVNPDTSPRGLNIPGDSDHWDFGVGAGFYVNASQEPWSKNYKMYNYITSELVDLINTNFSVDKENKSIMGHSMGGHGALICALKNPGQYRAVSVFSPICNPINCPWGTKAFNGYLGAKQSNKWEDWDATELSKTYNGPLLPIFIEQGSADKFFLEKQLLPENFLKASEVNKNISVKYNCREGYDHSYFFIATFIENNIKEHTNLIKN